jgi:hypothetical protein
VANGVLTGKWRECVRSENLTHEANIFMKTCLFAIGNRDAGGFLPAVLQCKKPEERKLSCVGIC